MIADSNSQNDTPGRFYESSVDVPNNTPCCSSAAPDSPRSAFTDNLVVIDELLEELPGPYASKPSSPAPSVFGTSTSKFSSLLFAFMHMPQSQAPASRLYLSKHFQRAASSSSSSSKIQQLRPMTPWTPHQMTIAPSFGLPSRKTWLHSHHGAQNL